MKKTCQPFLTLCLSMVWVSVASEATHFTDGRLSTTGNLALMGLAAGLVFYCIIFVISRTTSEKIKRYSPIISAMLCIFMLLPFANALIAALYGVACGFFFASSLIEYLPHAKTKNRMFKLGLSAGIFTTAVYPFGALYALLSPHVTPFLLRLSVFLPLFALAVFIFFLRSETPGHASTGTEIHARFSRGIFLMVSVVVALAVFNHLLNSGVLEQNGGTANAPLIFFINVILRLPMGMLMGYWSDRGRWHMAVGLPLAMMMLGCAASLFAGGAIGDYFMLSVFNCGGAAIVMLIHILGMQTAIWRNKNAVAACFGAMTHFILVAFFNMNSLGVSPQAFGEILRGPLTFLVIIAGLPTFLLIVQFLVNERLLDTIHAFFNLHNERAALTEKSSEESSEDQEKTAEPAMFDAGFSQAEKDIALLLIEGSTRRDISRKMHMNAAEVNQQINAIKDKVGCAVGTDPVVAAITKQYQLTRRESDMLLCLCRSMTNPEIAAELFLSEETVKIHVRNLIRKLPIENRSEIKAWMGTFKVI